MRGLVVITKNAEPNKQRFLYYVTGKRPVISCYDDEGNYYEEGFVEEEPVRGRFETVKEAKEFAENVECDYILA